MQNLKLTTQYQGSIPGDTSVWRFIGSLVDLDIFLTVRDVGRVEYNLRVNEWRVLEFALVFAAADK